ncbi:unnamed protein product [Paramecium primaurelia]|uniref:Uncharacterized protein n=1 Tax=Paramecium primaurelia TaxID=5886 RepID=A0A8S1LAQ0_PARPR|nr:unnamed protein product [Paramecium primaurelia]
MKNPQTLTLVVNIQIASVPLYKFVNIFLHSLQIGYQFSFFQMAIYFKRI